MLRQARRADIPDLHRVRMSVLENRLNSTVITEADYVPAIEDHGRGWLIEENGEVVGFAVGNRNGNIWALFVHPKHEARGFGKQLHDTMVSWLWSQGLGSLCLTTQPGTRAEQFYEAAGWKRVGLTGGEIRFELQPEQVASAAVPLRSTAAGIGR